ncbi:MAG: hypothetical protein FD157_3374 [Rhodocyclaceae bacterium]|nr:MAG: hypothetical protein FD157_3374 [Rhodocyclaceae bacterium]TNC97578.1 MAG: hypothetical protein FD118_4110 [Rhodocyclaceae bacterium]
MKANHSWLRQMAKLVFLLMMGASMSAEAGFLGFGGDSWKEEVLLHDGSKIVATRTVVRGGRHEIGQEPPIKEQSLSFTLPGTNEEVLWQDKFTEDVDGANFLPMMLDVQKGAVFLVVHPMGCLSYSKWGRPNPPYVVFKYQGKAWTRTSLQELPSQLKTPNLIFSSPDHEGKKAGSGIVKSETIRALYDGYRQPEYKTILREALPARELCPQYSSGPKPPIPITPSTSTK